MAKPLLPDAFWERIKPMLPEPKPRRFRYPGRKPVDDRKALTGILFVLKTGIAWEFLPREMGCGSGMTCWRRLRDWHPAGVWQELHEVLLAELNGADLLDWSRASVDRGKPGRPRHRPEEVYADRAYDSEPHRQRWRRRGINPRIARRMTPHGSGLGKFRWVVERTLSWLPHQRKLRLRTERRADIHEALTSLVAH